MNIKHTRSLRDAQKCYFHAILADWSDMLSLRRLAIFPTGRSRRKLTRRAIFPAFLKRRWW